MSKVQIQLNRQGVRSLLRSKKMQAVLKAKADDMAQACGDGYRSGLFFVPNRAVARVSAVTMEARLDNLKNNTILKALK